MLGEKRTQKERSWQEKQSEKETKGKHEEQSNKDGKEGELKN